MFLHSSHLKPSLDRHPMDHGHTGSRCRNTVRREARAHDLQLVPCQYCSSTSPLGLLCGPYRTDHRPTQTHSLPCPLLYRDWHPLDNSLPASYQWKMNLVLALVSRIQVGRWLYPEWKNRNSPMATACRPHHAQPSPTQPQSADACPPICSTYPHHPR